MAGRPVEARSIPRFPAIDRDLSLVVDEQVLWADIARAVDDSAPDELEAMGFVGIYRGKPVPAGKKSVTLSLRFRNDSGTLTHETADQLQAGVLGKLTEAVGAELRIQ